MDEAIRVSGVSKRYRLGRVGYGTLQADLARRNVRTARVLRDGDTLTLAPWQAVVFGDMI